MKTVPAAKEVMAKEAMRPVKLLEDERLNLKPNEVIAAMKEFARLHVEAALEAASLASKVQITGEDHGKVIDYITNSTEYTVYTDYNDGVEHTEYIKVHKESILNAYPPDKII